MLSRSSGYTQIPDSFWSGGLKEKKRNDVTMYMKIHHMSANFQVNDGF